MHRDDTQLALTHFTFDYMHRNPQFPRMILNENFNRGRGVKRIAGIISTSATLFLAKIDTLPDKGHADGTFCHCPQALHLYLSILALSFIHVSNAHTLRATFGPDLGTPDFLESRKAHVRDMVLRSLMRRP